MNNDLTISFFDCCKAETGDVFSFAGERTLSGEVFRFEPSYAFGPSFSLAGAFAAPVWRLAEKCWSEVTAVCLTVGARTQEAKRRIAAFFRGKTGRTVCAGRRLLARMSILRV